MGGGTRGGANGGMGCCTGGGTGGGVGAIGGGSTEPTCTPLDEDDDSDAGAGGGTMACGSEAMADGSGGAVGVEGLSASSTSSSLGGGDGGGDGGEAPGGDGGSDGGDDPRGKATLVVSSVREGTSVMVTLSRPSPLNSVIKNRSAKVYPSSPQARRARQQHYHESTRDSTPG